MRSISVLSVVLACAVLAGCASMGMQKARAGGTQNDPCVGDHSALCEVIVSVTGCAPNQINADPPKVYVARGSTPIMQFKLSMASMAGGWRFATQATTGKDGIVLKTTAGQREITPRGQSPVVITFNNAHSGSALAEYEYGINIIQLGGSGGGAGLVCPQKDPWIVNL